MTPAQAGIGLLTLLPFICYDESVGRKVLQGGSLRNVLYRSGGDAYVDR